MSQAHPSGQKKLPLRLSPWAMLGLAALVVVLLAALGLAAMRQGPQLEYATLTLQYEEPQAGEVILVWGINGWGHPPRLPAGTWVESGVLNTRMEPGPDGVFTARLGVPAGSGVDYVFHITRLRGGAQVEIWDNNTGPDANYRTQVDSATSVRVRASEAAQIEVQLQSRAPVVTLLTPAVTGAGGAALALAALAVVGPARRRLRLDALLRPGVLLGCALALGALLRLQYLDQPCTSGFSWRETSVAMMAQNYYLTNPNILFPEVNWSGPGPNYQGREFQTVSYLASLIYRVIGQADWVGRAVGVLFGVWGIYALYRLVQLTNDERTALAAAAAMAVLPGAVGIERSFLPEPAMVALVVTSCWLFVAYLRDERPSLLAMAALVGAWGFCSKIPGLIVGLPLAYAVFATFGWRGTLQPRRLAALAAFAVGALLPVLAYYLWARHLALSYPPYHFAGGGNWLWDHGLERWLAERYHLDEAYDIFSTWFWSAAGIALVVVGLAAALRRGPAGAEGPRLRWFFHWWLVGGAVFYAIGAYELIKNPWNFHILNPAAAALIGIAVIWAGDLVARLSRQPVAPLVATAVLCWLTATGLQELRVVYHPWSYEGRQLGMALATLIAPGDLVVTSGTSLADPVPIYYAGTRGWTLPASEGDRDWTVFGPDAEVAAELDALRDRGARWYGIVGKQYRLLEAERPGLLRLLEERGELRESTFEYRIYALRP